MKTKHYPIVVAGLVLWVAILYANSLQCEFHFDDRWNILDNEPIRVDSLSPSALYAAVRDGAYPTRPVATLSFAFNYYLGGYDATGYHVFNVGVHLLAGLGLLFLILELLRLPRFEARFSLTRRRQIALVATALWMCHPLQVQAITYVVQRMASMAGMFTVWSLAAILWGLRQEGARRITALAAASGLFLLAIGSKESAVVLPVFVVAGPFLLRRGPLRKRGLALAGLGAGLAGLGAALLGRGPAGTLALIEHVLGKSDNWLTIPRAFVRGLSLFVAPFPSRLSLEHHLPFSTSILEPASTLPALLALLSVIALSVWLIGRNRLYATALLWFLSLFLLETVVVSHDPLMEHRFYLPSMGLCLLVALGFDSLRRSQEIDPVSRQGIVVPGKADRGDSVAGCVPEVERSQGRRGRAKRGVIAWDRLGQGAGSRHALAGLLVILAFLSASTVQRNRVWRTSVSLGEDSVRTAPRRVRAYGELVWGLMQQGREAEANAYFERAKALDPTGADELMELGVMAEVVERDAEVIALLRRSFSLNPGRAGRARLVLARALLKTGRLEEALAELHTFRISVDPRSEGGRRAQKLLDSVLGTLRDRLRLRPDDLRTRARLAGLLISLKEPREASEHLRAILERSPRNPSLWSNLGFCHWDLKEYAEAERCQRRAIRLDPKFPGAHYGLGMVLDELGQRAEAKQSFRRYLSVASPGDVFRVYAEERIRKP